MAGKKLFSNMSGFPLMVTLLIRRSENPDDSAGTKGFTLAPFDAQWQEYGNDTDIYLNGFRLVSTNDGSLQGQQDIVVVRGSSLDNQLNMYNAVDFIPVNGAFSISTRQA